MDNVFLVCTAHREASDLTRESAQLAGIPLVESKGVSDTALARNVAFDRTLAAIGPNVDVCIFCDDDMGFTLEGLTELVAAARELNKAVSALYVLKNGNAACHQVHAADDWRKALWWTGLGLIAVPVRLLRALQEQSEIVNIGPEKKVHAFTWSGPDNGRWMSEDYRFCQRLGGVILAPVGAAHSKTIPLWPDDSSLETVRRGGRETASEGNNHHELSRVQATHI